MGYNQKDMREMREFLVHFEYTRNVQKVVITPPKKKRNGPKIAKKSIYETDSNLIFLYNPCVV